MRSAQLTSAHNIPTAASTQSRTGKPPAAVKSSRRTEATSKVGRVATSHSAMRMPVADVDQGSDTATPTASQSASRSKRTRSKRDRMEMEVIRSMSSLRRILMQRYPRTHGFQ